MTSPKITPEKILQAIALAIPSETIEAAIESTQSQRQRMLPTHLVVALIIAMSLWLKDSIEDVLENLVNGLNGQWIHLKQRWKKPSKSSISEARQRVGSQVMSRLFHWVARPLGTEQTPGVLLNGLRLMAVDGSFLSWIAPDRKSRKKGAQRMTIRVIEYTIAEQGVEQTYRLITDLQPF